MIGGLVRHPSVVFGIFHVSADAYAPRCLGMTEIWTLVLLCSDVNIEQLRVTTLSLGGH